jgi:hypothetical protein
LDNVRGESKKKRNDQWGKRLGQFHPLQHVKKRGMTSKGRDLGNSIYLQQVP